MVWDHTMHGGFTNGAPWLPVKPPQHARNVAAQQGVAGSVLETYRHLLAFRREAAALRVGKTRFHDVPEPVLMFDRTLDGTTLTCAFNLSAGTVQVAVQGELTGISQNAEMGNKGLTLGPNGFAFFV